MNTEASPKVESSVVFYPTEKLKKAAENKPIKIPPPEDGKEFDPSWDVVARALWPATKENQTDRESLAGELMWACQDDTILGAAPTAGIIMSRMIQRLMGNAWMEDWMLRNERTLRVRISVNKREYGGFSNIWKKFFN